MATMITNECINCGACEPECPNNAIAQGESIFIIDPNLCTECVGFHDFEACAAVCPVDCCVTDPNNIESEEVLIARARALHREVQFGETFESRFRKGQGKGAAPAKRETPASQAPAAAAASQPAANGAPAAPAAPEPTANGRSAAVSPAAAPAAYGEAQVNYVQLPSSDSWTIPVRCFKCNEAHVEPVRNFMIGNVIWCPHCHKSMVVRDNLNFHIRALLKDAYERWENDRAEFTRRRDLELAQFIEKRNADAKRFESQQQQELTKIRRQLEAVGEGYDAPGKPLKKGARFGWG